MDDDDGLTPAYDDAGVDAWADGMAWGRDVEAGRQGDHALRPKIFAKQTKTP